MASSSGESSRVAHGKGLVSKLGKLRAIPKSFSTVLYGSAAYNALINYSGAKIIAEIEKFLKDDKGLRLTPLAEFVMSLGLGLLRISGVRKNRWGKFELQCKEAMDLLALSKASAEEKSRLGWVQIPGDGQVVEFLESKLGNPPSDGEVILDPKEEFFVKIYEVSKGKLPFQGAIPVFANYQVIQINHPSAAKEEKGKKRKDRGGEEEGSPAGEGSSEGATATATPPPPKKSKKSANNKKSSSPPSSAPAPPASSEPESSFLSDEVDGLEFLNEAK